jgi:hypothetical protein
MFKGKISITKIRTNFDKKFNDQILPILRNTIILIFNSILIAKINKTKSQ